MATLQQTLAQTTRSLHERIEDNPFMHALQHHESLEKPYQWLLEKLYTFAMQGERQLELHLDESDGFALDQRYRAHLLLDDLIQMGLTPPNAENTYFSTIDTTGKTIGLLYVMEGSRKGGQFLSALLQQDHSHFPMSYLQGYGYATDTQWEHFCILLERYANTPLQEEIIAGACTAFEILERIFHDNR